MKKFYTMIAAVCVGMTAAAQNVTIDGVEYQLNGDNTATVTGCDSSVTDLVIPGTITNGDVTYAVKEIAQAAFDQNSKLTSVIIEDGVETIGFNAFHWCDAIKEFTLPSTLTSIGSYALEWCDALEKVTCYAVVPPTAGMWAFDFDTVATVPIYVPKGSVDAYRAADEWSDFKNYQELDETITGIENIVVNSQAEAVRYFNLQGVQVSNPDNGVFLKMEGSKVTKVMK